LTAQAEQASLNTIVVILVITSTAEFSRLTFAILKTATE
jgi:hypothetical protein